VLRLFAIVLVIYGGIKVGLSHDLIGAKILGYDCA
jgi:hypothetical protein